MKTNGEIFAVGVPKGGAAGNGAVYFFHYADNIWRQSGAALTTRSGNNFGESIALQNRTIIVGSPGDDNSVIDEDDERGSTGAAYIYRKRGDRWELISKLLPHDAIEGDDLGHAVALDGDTAVVGSPDNSAGGPESGAAYIYTKQGEKWAKQVKLIDTVSSSEDQFGYSVAITDKMAVVLWRGRRTAVERVLSKAEAGSLTDGIKVRIKGELTFYAPQGRVQLQMTAIDPPHT